MAQYVTANKPFIVNVALITGLLNVFSLKKNELVETISRLCASNTCTLN